MKLPIVSRKTAEESQFRLEELNQEYQNYRRRNADLKDQSYRQGKNDAIRELLSVYDNLLRALEQPCADEAFLAGIHMTINNMKKSLERLGVTEIEALGAVFDPNYHEAMDHIEDPELAENVVSRVILTGFCQGDTVLRHALVVVAN